MAGVAANTGPGGTRSVLLEAGWNVRMAVPALFFSWEPVGKAEGLYDAVSDVFSSVHVAIANRSLPTHELVQTGPRLVLVRFCYAARIVCVVAVYDLSILILGCLKDKFHGTAFLK